MKFILICSLFFSTSAFAATNDYANLPFLDQNIEFGVGLTYSKLEANSDVGNYFLLSQANPRFEINYSSPIIELYRHKFTGAYVHEIFRPENPSLVIKMREPQGSFYLSWQPMWYNESQLFVKYFKFALKNSSVPSELPDPFNVNGDIANRYSLEAGVGFTWYALTVSKFPLGLDAEILYSQTLFDHSKITYYNGYTYRFGIDFEFKKRSLFSGWGFRAFYEFEEVKNEYSHTVDKEIGVILNKAFTF
ncbi:hypothetical protein K2P97_12545 [bacterium]|nr:hypothetical protein [bacterium]